MNCQRKFITTLAAIVFGIALLSFGVPVGFLEFSSSYVATDPLARLFQVLFILFIISPPLMVVFLYLIWKELKERNK